MAELGWEDDSSGEAYDVDLIYTFDNEKINEYFLWENGPYPEYTHIPTPEEYYAMPEGERWSDDRTPYRPRYYTMTASYVDLVERTLYYEWRDSGASREEYPDTCIAVRFIKEFNISKGDFERANEARRTSMEERGEKPEDNPRNELYPVDLIYTFDNEKINEYFLWKNGPYEY